MYYLTKIHGKAWRDWAVSAKIIHYVLLLDVNVNSTCRQSKEGRNTFGQPAYSLEECAQEGR